MRRTLFVALLLVVSLMAVTAAQAQTTGVKVTFQPGAPEGGLAVGIAANENVDLLLSGRGSPSSLKIQVGARYILSSSKSVSPFAQAVLGLSSHDPKYTLSGGFLYHANDGFAVVGRAGFQSANDKLGSFSLIGIEFSR